MAKNKNMRYYLLSLLAFACMAVQGAISTRECVVKVAQSQIGVKEATNNNDGVQVEKYLNSVGLNKGYSWCAAFVSWTYDAAGVSNPNSAWSPDYFKSNVIYKRSHYMKQEPKAGDVFGIYFGNLKRIAHVGIITEWGVKETTTIEGNTNDNGSRLGDGVYNKIRLTKQIYEVSNYIDFSSNIAFLPRNAGNHAHREYSNGQHARSGNYKIQRHNYKYSSRQRSYKSNSQLPRYANSNKTFRKSYANNTNSEWYINSRLLLRQHKESIEIGRKYHNNISAENRQKDYRESTHKTSAFYSLVGKNINMDRRHNVIPCNYIHSNKIHKIKNIA